MESKKSIRKRTGKSPDRADAVMALIFLARERFDLVPAEKPPAVLKSEPAKGQFDALAPQGRGRFRAFLERRYGGLAKTYVDSERNS